MDIAIGIGLPLGTDNVITAGGSDPSGGLDNLYLETGNHFLLESHATDDVLLLE